ncbi:MAG: hypothetical protein R3224_10775 [Balneolaceae bacterium]|nr:hypothetical protein [Balneolaceae bacterium]
MFQPQAGEDDPSSTRFDPRIVVSQIRQQEREQTIEPGRRIHEFQYRELNLILDLDITKTYRIAVYRGKERLYSFSVFCGQGEYGALEEAYGRIATFLEGDRNPGTLPDDDRIKGFYYGG